MVCGFDNEFSAVKEEMFDRDFRFQLGVIMTDSAEIVDEFCTRIQPISALLLIWWSRGLRCKSWRSFVHAVFYVSLSRDHQV